MRVKFLKAYKGHQKGSSYEASPNEAFGLIDSGVAEVTKDMTPDDYKQAGDKNGSTTQLRTNRSTER